MQKLHIFFFSLLSLVLSIPSVYAETFEVTEVPTYLANQLGCSEFIGGLLASVIVLAIIMLPLIYLTKGKAYSLYIIFSLLILAPLVGLNWVPVWVYIIIMLLIALGFGKELASFLGGIRR